LVSTEGLQEHVRTLVRAGVELDVIEREVIERAPLAPDERDALWLFAWALESRGSGRFRREGRAASGTVTARA
jgi:hypothetical protein